MLHKAQITSNTSRACVQIQEKDYSSNTRVGEKSHGVTISSIVGSSPVCSPALELLGVFADHCSVQFSSVTQSCPTLCDPTDCSTPGFPVQDQLPELAQIHVHQVGDAIQPSYLLSSPSPPVFNLSQHQGLCKGHWNVDWRQSDCQTILQQILCVCVCVCCGGSAENYNMDYNHGEPHVSPYTAREGENFHRGGKKLGGLQERKSPGFYWLSPCQERREVFLLPFGSCYHQLSHFWPPDSI